MGRLPYRLTDRQIGGQPDSLMNKQVDGLLTYRSMDKQTDKRTARQWMDRLSDRLMEIQIGGEPDSLMDKQIDGQTDRHTD